MANSMFVVLCVLSLFTIYTHSSPIKRSSTLNECFYMYYGSGCMDTEAVIDVNLPKNVTETIVETLPAILNIQETMAIQIENMTLVNGQQEKQIRNLTTTVAKMADVLDTITNLLNEKLPKPETLTPARDCQDIALQGPHESGTYIITPDDNLGSFPVRCEFDSMGTAWTVFQRRFDGSVDFYRGWQEYEDGFGSPDWEYWMGLKQIYRLVKNDTWLLRIDIVYSSSSFESYALYDSFELSNSASNYTLSIGSCINGLSCSQSPMYQNNNMAFTTYDHDNDASDDENCASFRHGAWWYNSCGTTNLNGRYYGGYKHGGSCDSYSFEMAWAKCSGPGITKAKMKLRRVVSGLN